MPTAYLTRARHHRTLSVRLEREWEQLRNRPAVLERARSWHVTAIPFASLDELLRLAGFKTPASDDANDVLRRLVIVAADDPLAARIVFQRLVPGLLAIVRREQLRDPWFDAFDVLAAEAWLAIVTYRVDRRPTDIAARLLNDARHRAFTNPRRKRQRSREEPVPPAQLDLPRPVLPGSTFEELTIVLREARHGGLSDDDLAAVREYLGVESLDHVAAEHGVTARTIRNRRSRSIERIRRCAA